MNPEKLFERLINNEISRDEFEALLVNLQDDDLRTKYDSYLESKFMDEIESHFSKPAINTKPETFTSQNNRSESKKIRKFYPIAAILLVLICLTFSLVFVTTNDKNEQYVNTPQVENEAQLLIKSTPNKRMFRMRLEDGSLIHLNAVSSISYPKEFTKEKREVEIKGEAYFDVERDENRPFEIKVKNYLVKVLGTSFNIKAYEDEENFSVAVESGTVEVIFNSEEIRPVTLNKNQKLLYSPKNNVMQILEVNTADELSWRKGILRFNATPMKEVEKMLERWYGIEITIEDTSIYNKSLTGIHQNENIKSVIESITYATGTKYLLKENNILIKN